MTDLKPEDLVKPIEPEKAAAFLEEAARYFSKLPDNGEDQAYWANVYNADNCRRVSALVSSLLADRARMEKALERLIPLAQKWEFVESRQFSYGGGGSEPSPAEWGVEVSYQQTREAGPFEQFLADVEAFHNSADEEADPEHPEWLHDSQIARQALGASQ